MAYIASDLESMTIPEIKSLAAEHGYNLTKTRKADMIAEFLEQEAAL
ncbi:Rho termination factor N-terminal domain-containing protein [Hungatella hathewayi]